MARHLILNLSAPLMAFGGEAVDNRGVIRDFPALSMVTGLFANALGWDRSEGERHDRLQSRLRIGAGIQGESARLHEYQNARLYEDDKGWTTRGVPEGRKKSGSYVMKPDGRKSMIHQRYMDFHVKMLAYVVVRLEPTDEAPTLDEIANALNRPARPLFIGRKPCIPTGPVMAGFIEADNIVGALASLKFENPMRAQWPDGEGTVANDRMLDVCDERNWITGLHGGWRLVREGVITRLEKAA